MGDFPVEQVDEFDFCHVVCPWGVDGYEPVGIVPDPGSGRFNLNHRPGVNVNVGQPPPAPLPHLCFGINSLLAGPFRSMNRSGDKRGKRILFEDSRQMNTITIVMTVLILWAVMGLGFLSKYSDVRRKGGSALDAWTSYEGIFFMVTVIVPLLTLVYRTLA
jgi:hypothetical protein